MSAYYNEFDPGAAAWLRELIAQGLIAPGDVDERSIKDVKPDDLKNYTQHHFFAGIGGWSLALRLAGWPDDRPVWTGSCPCQPFSAAGKRKGFADDRHLWPVFRGLIAERAPAVVFGEQVASATDWLRLVRGDLEALEYAVGAMPIEAASAGADHLRDRFWFVADHAASREGRRGIQRPGEGAGAAQQRPSGQLAGSGAHNGVGQADTDDAGSQGRTAERERADQRLARADGVADADLAERRIGDQQSSGQLAQPEQDQGACIGLVPDRSSEQVGAAGQPRQHSGVEWVIGADGKARRVKSGICLLVDGFPSRVGLLRGFGNAIDSRPAAEFIGALLDVEAERNAVLSVDFPA